MIKAIIFDLDDTLCDTTNTITKLAFVNVAKAISKETGKDWKVVYKKIQEILEKHGPSFAANKNRITKAVGGKKETMLKAYHSVSLKKLKLMPGVIPLLNKLRKKYKLALASTGTIIQQMEKLKHLKIEKYFDIIEIDDVYNDEIDKSYNFKRIMKKFKVKPAEVIVVGDKLTNEIKNANNLGMSTMRIKRGKYSHLKPKNDKEIPDYDVKNLKEAEKILMLL